MLPLERQKGLLEFLKQNHASTVSDLAAHFQVHEATIRRDLTTLEKKGLMKRTHGGVMLEEVHSEPSFQVRESVQYEEKERIGNRAAELIEDGDNIILDSGTTTLHIAKSIKNKKNLTVVTNDINIAATLRFSKSIKVIVTGGVLFHESYMLNGMITDETLSTVNIQKAFLGTPAFHHEKGLTHFDEYLVSAKRGMIRAAKRIIVTADHTKIGRVSIHSVADINKIDDLVIGKELEEADIKRLQNTDIQLHLA
ncbi:DeoR/GlpR family DNA-binding transcription regulator [Pseudogracilibacillus sp. SO30301A]|uniref:DeoR/GlpR family DNA-binding transcription regulator n=1 Tax=Pseudogracilibacillus sp. SO30301A TaxID=3098291 RepID=UPI00300E30BC